MNHLVIKTLRTQKPIRTKGDGSKFYRCPHCNKPKLEVDGASRKWFCHRCQKGGLLKGRKVWDERPIDLPLPEELPVFTPLEAGRGIEYLKKHRGLGARQIEELHPHSGPTALRVYFPCYRLGSNSPNYWVGRLVLTDGAEEILPPYWFPPDGWYDKKSSVVWGLHRVVRGHEVVVCEGIFDAVWVPNSIALLGSHLSVQQARVIQELNPTQVTFMLDGDAYYKAVKAAHLLSRVLTKPIYIVRLPADVDPDDLKRKAKLWLGRKERLS